MDNINQSGYSVAIVGATGMVGRKFLEVLEQRGFPVGELTLFASARTAGEKLMFRGAEYTVIELTPENVKKCGAQIALFSAGGSVSQEYAPQFAAVGAVVIDNSSNFRMDPDVPLIVPEVNPHAIEQYKKKNIIANPNCSTIQAMPVLAPLLKKYGIKRVVYSTYQAVSGAGKRGIDDLRNGVNGAEPEKFQHPIAFNVIPHIDVYLENGYMKEEQKMIDETRKILEVPDMRVTATTVRVPVYNAHSESVNVEFEKPFELDELRDLLRESPSVIIMDDPENNVYPMPVYIDGHDEVFVGRIRRDFSVESGVNMFIVADNLRKGAATNAVQIAELLVKYWTEG